MDIQIAKVTHFYDKIGVAVIDVFKQSIKVGDVVRISGHDNEFTQAVTSLHVEHKQVSEVGPEGSAGMKVEQPVKAGDVLFLVEKR